MKQTSKFKKGAASFYMVAIATLILVIVAASFAAVVISELARTSNNDLAQSAYDSAMAGVEDAKLAYSNYLKCKEQSKEQNIAAEEPKSGDELNCKAIMWYAEYPDCYSVAHMLGRLPIGEEGEVEVKEGDAGNNMQQAYTCAMLDLKQTEDVAVIESNNPIDVMPFDLDDGMNASDVNAIRISWKFENDDEEMSENFNGEKVEFSADGESGKSSLVIGVGLVQAGDSFKLSDFEMTVGEGENGKTDRGMVYLVPSVEEPSRRENANYELGYYDKEKKVSVIEKNGFLKSNDKTVQNKPYVVFCPENTGGESGGYTCTAIIELPKPVDGERIAENSRIITTVPYGKASVVRSIEFCANVDSCGGGGGTEGGSTNAEGIQLNTQVTVDVTGRANDLYRRIETVLEAPGSRSPELASYALQAMGGIEKIQSVKCEANFIDESNCK